MKTFGLVLEGGNAVAACYICKASQLYPLSIYCEKCFKLLRGQQPLAKLKKNKKLRENKE
jgi:hypothetical protein